MLSDTGDTVVLKYHLSSCIASDHVRWEACQEAVALGFWGFRPPLKCPFHTSLFFGRSPPCPGSPQAPEWKRPLRFPTHSPHLHTVVCVDLLVSGCHLFPVGTQLDTGVERHPEGSQGYLLNGNWFKTTTRKYVMGTCGSKVWNE